MAKDRKAVARSDDPQTSWDAAHSLTRQRINRDRTEVIGMLGRFGPMTDDEILARVEAAGIPHTPQSLRTRRQELVTDGLVRMVVNPETGKVQTRKTRNGRYAQVWELVPE